MISSAHVSAPVSLGDFAKVTPGDKFANEVAVVQTCVEHYSDQLPTAQHPTHSKNVSISNPGDIPVGQFASDETVCVPLAITWSGSTVPAPEVTPGAAPGTTLGSKKGKRHDIATSTALSSSTLALIPAIGPAT